MNDDLLIRNGKAGKKIGDVILSSNNVTKLGNRLLPADGKVHANADYPVLSDMLGQENAVIGYTGSQALGYEDLPDANVQVSPDGQTHWSHRTPNRLYKSTDQCKTWQLHKTFTKPPGGAAEGKFHFAFDTITGNIIFGLSEVGITQYKIAVSLDGGQTWGPTGDFNLSGNTSHVPYARDMLVMSPDGATWDFGPRRGVSANLGSLAFSWSGKITGNVATQNSYSVSTVNIMNSVAVKLPGSTSNLVACVGTYIYSTNYVLAWGPQPLIAELANRRTPLQGYAWGKIGSSAIDGFWSFGFTVPATNKCKLVYYDVTNGSPVIVDTIDLQGLNALLGYTGVSGPDVEIHDVWRSEDTSYWLSVRNPILDCTTFVNIQRDGTGMVKFEPADVDAWEVGNEKKFLPVAGIRPLVADNDLVVYRLPSTSGDTGAFKVPYLVTGDIRDGFRKIVADAP